MKICVGMFYQFMSVCLSVQRVLDSELSFFVHKLMCFDLLLFLSDYCERGHLFVPMCCLNGVNPQSIMLMRLIPSVLR